MPNAPHKRIYDFFELPEAFPDEEACRSYLFSMRWPDGFSCPRCASTRHYRLLTRNLYECASCRYQASLTAGTVMEGTRTPLKAWFTLIFLMASDSISVLSASHLLRISYKRASLMARKIRGAMASGETLYHLTGPAEMDESRFGSPAWGGKHGQGARNDRAVLVWVGLQGRKPLSARMTVLEDTGPDTRDAIEATVQTGVPCEENLNGPGAPGWFDSEPEVPGGLKHSPGRPLWVDMLASAVKAVIKGVHHGVSPRRLQEYLSEYCWCFSRRLFPGECFDRLLWCCIRAGPVA